MMFIYKTAKFTSVWNTILKISAIFVHQTLTEHALYSFDLLALFGREGCLLDSLPEGFRPQLLELLT